jgi:hypothetical protein
MLWTVPAEIAVKVTPAGIDTGTGAVLQGLPVHVWGPVVVPFPSSPSPL